MKFVFGALSAAILLAGCAGRENLSLPRMTDDVIYAADVLYSFECELAEALQTDFGPGANNQRNIFRNKAARVAFELRGTSSRGGGGNLKFTVPTGLSTLTVDTDLSRSAKATRTMEFRVNYDTNNLTTCTEDFAEKNNLTRIASGLGLGEWAVEIATLEGKLGKTVEVSNYSVEFDIGNTVKVSPTLKRTLSENNPRELGFEPSGTQGSYHKIAVTLADLKKPAKKSKRSTARSSQPSSVVIPQSVERELDRILDRVLERDPS